MGRLRSACAAWLAVLALVCSACGKSPSPDTGTATAAPPAADAGDPAVRPKIVALGDSLTAGLGLLQAQAYPSLLQDEIDRNGYNFEVVNAGVSGDTSAAGLQRLDWALDGNVKILIVELGANDGLRGLPVDQMKNNLGQIIERAQQRGIAVLLLGMEAPPNYGLEYVASFRRAYRDLAREYDVPLVPFMLDKVAGNAGLNQADGIHPNAQGTQIVAATVWHSLQPMVDAVAAS
jgi:acyl-CoA thioesterase-1